MNYRLRSEIGERIEKIRIEKLNGMSKSKLAKTLNTSSQNLSHIIRGKNSFTLEKAIDFCEFADVSMDYIFRGIEENKHINLDSINEAVSNYNDRNR